jgi:hypothetical protein
MLCLGVTIGYLPYHNITAIAQVVAPEKSNVISTAKSDPPATNTTMTSMSNDYLLKNYTKQLKPSSNIATFSNFDVKNLRVDTYGGWFVYAVWEQNVSAKNSAVFFSRSVDGGKNWTPGEAISNATEQASNPHVGAFADEVYVIWEQKNPNNNDVFLRKSLDAGSTFGKPINVSNVASTANATDSSLTIDKSTGKVIIAWAAGTYGYANCGRC